jgi:WD40 repeat protein
LLDHSSSLSSVRVSPDGTRVAIADVSGAVHIVPVGSGASRLTHGGERKLSSAGAAIVRFSADGRMIAVGSDSGDTHVLDAATGTRLALLPGESKVAQLEFSRAGDRRLAG